MVSPILYGSVGVNSEMALDKAVSSDASTNAS